MVPPIGMKPGQFGQRMPCLSRRATSKLVSEGPISQVFQQEHECASFFVHACKITLWNPNAGPLAQLLIERYLVKIHTGSQSQLQDSRNCRGKLGDESRRGSRLNCVITQMNSKQLAEKAAPSTNGFNSETRNLGRSKRATFPERVREPRTAQFGWRKWSSGNQAHPLLRMKFCSRSYFSSICSTDLLVCAVAVATTARAFFLFRRTMTECASPEASLYSMVR
jgi:hypothetical protein